MLDRFYELVITPSPSYTYRRRATVSIRWGNSTKEPLGYSNSIEYPPRPRRRKWIARLPPRSLFKIMWSIGGWFYKAADRKLPFRCSGFSSFNGNFLLIKESTRCVDSLRDSNLLSRFLYFSDSCNGVRRWFLRERNTYILRLFGG